MRISTQDHVGDAAGRSGQLDSVSYLQVLALPGEELSLGWRLNFVGFGYDPYGWFHHQSGLKWFLALAAVRVALLLWLEQLTSFGWGWLEAESKLPSVVEVQLVPCWPIVGDDAGDC